MEKTDYINSSIIDRFEQMVSAYGEKDAVVDFDTVLTYSELSNRAKELSLSVAAARDKSILLLYHQGADYIVALLAVLYAGKVPVPLDPEYPEKRIKTISVKSMSRTILADEQFDVPANLLRLDLSRKMDSSMPESDLEKETICIFTSGSTAQPKGVMHSSKSFMHNIYRFSRLFEISSADRCTLIYPPAFFGGLRDIFTALLNGATLYHYPVRRIGFDGLAEFLNKHEISIFTAVVSAFRLFSDQLKEDEVIKTVRILRLGGEVALKRDFNKYRTHFNDSCKLINGLAATETGLSRQMILDKEADFVGNRIPNGYPVEDVESYLHESGELIIESEFLAIGYKNDPQLTRRSFVPLRNGKMRFKSGDFGEIRDDCLTYRGRTDQQIKLRGYRIDLNEIEAAAMSISDSIEYAAAGFQPLTNHIILLLQSKPLSQVDENQIREALLAWLPRYMQPARIIEVDEIPRLKNEKLDRKKLKRLFAKLDRQAVSVQLPAYDESSLEVFIQKNWQGLLSQPSLAINSNFFESGGDSITAIQSIMAIEKFSKTKLPNHLIFQYPDLLQLAAVIRNKTFKAKYKWLNLFNAGSSIPLFWAVGAMNLLKKYMSHQQSIYFIDSHYSSSAELPDESLTMEDLCAEYLKEIQAVQPVGPYFVGGFSMGAVFAYEIACQLQSKGELVAGVYMLDPGESSNVDQDILSFINKNFGGDDSKSYDSNADMIASLKADCEEHLENTGDIPADLRMKYIYAFYKELKDKYTVGDYSGPLIVFQRRLNIDDEKRVWKNLRTDQLKWIEMATDDHMTLIFNPDLAKQWVAEVEKDIQKDQT